MPLRSRLTPFSLISSLAALLAAALIAASSSGAVAISWSDFARLFWGAPQAGDALLHNVLVDIRLPRVIFSAIAGAALAVTGATMQALFRNPLAEPGLVGISAGAALGAVLVIVLGAGGFASVSLAAFGGSIVATFLAYAIGRRHRGVAGLLLAGIAINTIAGSAIGILTYIADDTQLRDLTFWSMGSLAGATWTIVYTLGVFFILLMAVLCRHWRLMNALLLGEREAVHLGFRLKAARRRLIVLTALIVGPLVAVTGGIGFVGLVVPHVIRMLLGAHHRYLLPACMVAGALLLTLADWLARCIVSPAELPIGLLTSLIGGPFFLWLLTRPQNSRI